MHPADRNLVGITGAGRLGQAFAIDLGDLITGGAMQQIRGPLAGVNLIRLPGVNS